MTTLSEHHNNTSSSGLRQANSGALFSSTGRRAGGDCASKAAAILPRCADRRDGKGQFLNGFLNNKQPFMNRPISPSHFSLPPSTTSGRLPLPSSCPPSCTPQLHSTSLGLLPAPTAGSALTISGQPAASYYPISGKGSFPSPFFLVAAFHTAAQDSTIPYTTCLKRNGTACLPTWLLLHFPTPALGRAGHAWEGQPWELPSLHSAVKPIILHCNGTSVAIIERDRDLISLCGRVPVLHRAS